MSRDFLRPPDADAMTTRIVRLLEDEGLKQKMSGWAAEDAKNRFDIMRQVEEYLKYGTIIDEWNSDYAACTDTFPTTILEALACGTPVVATVVGGTPEQIEQGVTGFVTPPGDAGAIAAQIVRLLEDEGFRQRMEAKAAKDAKNRFDVEKQVTEYLIWYEKIIRNWSK